MKYFGYHTDQCDDVFKLLNYLEREVKFADDMNVINTNKYKNFYMEISYDKLIKHKEEIILGVFVNYARNELAELPAKLPDDYPKGYKALARKVIRNIYAHFHKDKTQYFSGWAEPQKRIEAFEREINLFFPRK